MRKFLFLLCTVVLTTLSYGQITAEILDPFVFEDIDVNNSPDLPVHISVTNTTTDTINVKWEIIREENCVENWNFLGCDNNQCYTAAISSNIDPDFPIDIPSVMPPNDSYDFVFHILPDSTVGCCNVVIEFSLVEDQENILASVDLPIQINDATCTTSTSDNLLPDLNLYPNPFTDFIKFDDGDKINNVKIINTKGQIVNSQIVNNNTISSLGILAKGMYMITFYDDNNQALKTTAIVKE